MSDRSRLLLMVLALAAVAFVALYASCAEAQDSVETHEVHLLQSPASEPEARFPLLQIGGNLNAFNRQDCFGGLLGVDLQIDADWFLGGLRASSGFLVNSPDDLLFTEFSGYAHLLAIGISDVTYRHYIDGHDLRVFGGFSYTNHVEDVIRVDVNLGLAYFNEAAQTEELDQIGFQVGARVLARFWRVQNTFYISAYQTMRFNDATLDLSGTEIVCDTAGVLAGEDLVCTIPERDGGGGGGGSILDWQTTGVILHNRTFIWVHEDGDTRWGPELEFRLEILPLRETAIWGMIGLRGQWGSN